MFGVKRTSIKINQLEWCILGFQRTTPYKFSSSVQNQNISSRCHLAILNFPKSYLPVSAYFFKVLSPQKLPRL
jgi:hypothetical protein